MCSSMIRELNELQSLICEVDKGVNKKRQRSNHQSNEYCFEFPWKRATSKMIKLNDSSSFYSLIIKKQFGLHPIRIGQLVFKLKGPGASVVMLLKLTFWEISNLVWKHYFIIFFFVYFRNAFVLHYDLQNEPLNSYK